MSKRHILNIITLVLVALILFFAREELVSAWKLLWQVDLRIFMLVLPVQFISYFASGAMLFSYLKQKGDLVRTSHLEATKMALELNFVNHILPSGGVSGASYMTWRLNKLGVNTSRATLAQVVRFAAAFASFAVLLVVAVVFITIDGGVNRFIILVSSGIVGAIIIGAIVVGYAIGSSARMRKLAHVVYRAINWVWRVILRQKNRELLGRDFLEKFFEEMHDDYVALRRTPKVLIRPFIWGIVFNVAEVLLFWITFLSLGTFVNPAVILIAIGLAGIVGAVLVTPGGAGGYEGVMILFLTATGVPGSVAVAGVLLARVVLILLTIATGYVFYHQSLKKYGGKPRADTSSAIL